MPHCYTAVRRDCKCSLHGAALHGTASLRGTALGLAFSVHANSDWVIRFDELVRAPLLR